MAISIKELRKAGSTSHKTTQFTLNQYKHITDKRRVIINEILNIVE